MEEGSGQGLGGFKFLIDSEIICSKQKLIHQAGKVEGISPQGLKDLKLQSFTQVGQGLQ